VAALGLPYVMGVGRVHAAHRDNLHSELRPEEWLS
jgi:hypothetical protein